MTKGRTMGDVSIEFSSESELETNATSMSSPKSAPNGELTLGRFFSAVLHDTQSSCYSCMPNLAPSSSFIGIDRPKETVEDLNNASATTSNPLDEESQHLSASSISDGLVKKNSTNETEQGSESQSSVAQADPFAHRKGKTLCWSNVNMVLVRFISYAGAFEN
jgi:hypothetical protein